MKRKKSYFTCLLAAMLLAPVLRAQAGGGETELYREILAMDSTVFSAFNKRDTASFKTCFTEDLEFYHDKSGLTGFTETIAFMTRVAQPGNDLNRQLVAGTSLVYPVPGFGAIQIGTHRFCHTENNVYGCSDFRFMHIWKKTTKGWKIARVISYDH